MRKPGVSVRVARAAVVASGACAVLLVAWGGCLVQTRDDVRNGPLVRRKEDSGLVGKNDAFQNKTRRNTTSKEEAHLLALCAALFPALFFHDGPRCRAVAPCASLCASESTVTFATESRISEETTFGMLREVYRAENIPFRYVRVDSDERESSYGYDFAFRASTRRHARLDSAFPWLASNAPTEWPSRSDTPGVMWPLEFERDWMPRTLSPQVIVDTPAIFAENTAEFWVLKNARKHGGAGVRLAHRSTLLAALQQQQPKTGDDAAESSSLATRRRRRSKPAKADAFRSTTTHVQEALLNRPLIGGRNFTARVWTACTAVTPRPRTYVYENIVFLLAPSADGLLTNVKAGQRLKLNSTASQNLQLDLDAVRDAAPDVAEAVTRQAPEMARAFWSALFKAHPSIFFAERGFQAVALDVALTAQGQLKALEVQKNYKRFRRAPKLAWSPGYLKAATGHHRDLLRMIGLLPDYSTTVGNHFKEQSPSFGVSVFVETTALLRFSDLLRLYHDDDDTTCTARGTATRLAVDDLLVAFARGLRELRNRGDWRPMHHDLVDVVDDARLLLDRTTKDDAFWDAFRRYRRDVCGSGASRRR